MTTKEKELMAVDEKAPSPKPSQERGDTEVVKRRESIFDLVSSLTDDASRLLRKETQLAKAEITEKLKAAGKGLATMMIGAATLTAGFVVLLFAAAVGAVALIRLTGLSTTASILIGFAVMGALMATVGFVIVKKGKDRLSARELKPERFARTFKNTKEWAKKKIL